MSDKELAAVRLAIGALKKSDAFLFDWHENNSDDEADHYDTARALNASAIDALHTIISQDVLHRMAEDAREIGLTMDGWSKIGCVNHDCDECKAREQQPAEPDIADIIAGELKVSRGTAYDLMREALKQTEQPADEPFMWVCNSLGDDEFETTNHRECEYCIPLYTRPQPADDLREFKKDMLRREYEQQPDDEPVAIHQVLLDGGWADRNASEMWAYENFETRVVYTRPQPAAPAIPPGYKLVPEVPTKGMLDAVVTSMDEALHGSNAEQQYIADWKAMLAAAPQQNGGAQ